MACVPALAVPGLASVAQIVCGSSEKEAMLGWGTARAKTLMQEEEGRGGHFKVSQKLDRTSSPGPV